MLVVRNRYQINGVSGFDLYDSGVERIVWDGDQIVAEIRARADTTRVWENDDHNGLFFGRVIYTHGPGIDAPLALHRIGLESEAAPLTVVPLANWRGLFELARFDDGSTFKDEIQAAIPGAGRLDGERLHAPDAEPAGEQQLVRLADHQPARRQRHPLPPQPPVRPGDGHIHSGRSDRACGAEPARVRGERSG